MRKRGGREERRENEHKSPSVALGEEGNVKVEALLQGMDSAPARVPQPRLSSFTIQGLRLSCLAPDAGRGAGLSGLLPPPPSSSAPVSPSPWAPRHPGDQD